MSYAYSIVRAVELPRTDSIFTQVQAIRDYYHGMTGLWLPCEDAVCCLDRIRSERLAAAGEGLR